MAPKRKRPERGPSDSGPPRPSPHRPGDTALGQHDRGHRGGRNSRRNDRRDSNQSYGGGAPATPGPTSPTFPRPSSSSSTTNTPRSAPTVTRVPPPPPAPTSPIASGYDYTIITDERVSRWTKGGRQEVVDHGVQSRQDEDLTELTAIFQELTHSVVDLRLGGPEAGSVIKEMMAPDSTENSEGINHDTATLFLDTFQIFMEFEPDLYRDELQGFMIATEISPDLIRLILDPEVLKKLGLIREAFSKMGVRYATNVLYRQANYNLVREETEGYSKLLTEMFTTSSTEPPSTETVQATFERTKGLIGAFDLDVGRVLDVLMDIFAAILIKQFKFFVKFLRISSWWPRSQISRSATAAKFVGGLPIWALPDHSSWLTTEEEEASLLTERLARDVAFWSRAREVHMRAYFQLGERQPADAEMQRLADSAMENDPHADIQQRWIATTKTLPPVGNRDAAQILGFKLRFYSSEARNNSEIDVLPANLLYLAALLIKIGFISITDLWPHLWPLDEDIEQVKESKLKEIEEKEKEKRGGTTNALMMAGALPDDTLAPAPRRDAAPTKQEAEKKTAEAPESKLKPPKEQKGLLLICLLTIGAIPEALFILGRYDWILDAFAEDILPLIHRIINYSLEPLYKQSRPVGPFPSDSYTAKPMPDIDQSSATKGTVKLSLPPAKRTLKWPHPDKFDTNDGNAYRFYWDEWSDNVPVCQTVDDVFTLCSTFLNISGVNIAKDPSLVAKLASIGTKSMADDPSPPNISRWHDLLRRLLVPCLSLGEPNSSNATAVWNMLRQFPVKDRYNLYAEWFEGSISRLPPIKKAFARTRSDALSIMKRLSLDNLQEMARKLAKTAYSSPGIVFKVALDQIQAYSNLIQVFVECGQYFTEMGYDVLVWSVLSSLGQNRSRTQAGSILFTSQWLQALSKFSGKVFQRYAIMDPAPVIQYVNDQLFKGNATDLVILRELITSMGGVVSDVDFTEAQLRAMTGGELLRRETLINLGDRREKSAKSAQYLMRALVGNQMAGQLLVNIAQYRQSAIYKVSEGSSHIKYLATVLDDTHQTLVQYLELLRSNLDSVKFDALVPGTIELMRDYGLDVSLAFMVTRAGLRSKTMGEILAVKENSQARLAPDGDGDVSMGDIVEVNDAENSPTKTVNSRRVDAFHDSLQPLIQSIASVLPDETWTSVSPDFFVLFWSLQLNDLVFPQGSYIAENNRLKKAAEEVLRQKSENVRTALDRQQDQLLKQEQRREILSRLKQLNDEQKHDLEYFVKARFALIRQASSNTWLVGGMSKCNAVADALLEKCIIPRIQLSFLDVEYSFRMLKFLQECSVPSFKLMALYDRLFNHNRLRSLIFTCSVREAEHLGHFLKCILEELTKWHGDQIIYEKEALGEKDIKATKDAPGKKIRAYLGFATEFDADGKPIAFVEHKAFKDILLRWHKNLNIALRSCLGEMEWTHIRNAITVLKAILEYFPAIDFMGNKFLEQLKEITAREANSKNASEVAQSNRVDLSVAAQTAFSQLQKKKSAWVMIQAFRPGPAGEIKSGSATPAPNALRATAPEFKPSPSTRTRSIAEVEDGEVRDGKSRQAGSSFSQLSSQPASVPTRPSGPARDALREVNASGSQKTATNAPPSNPGTPKASAATTVSTPENRADPTKASTLPSRPELPRKPNVPLPSSVSVDAYGHIRSHDRRDGPPSRDGRDHRDSPRDPRDQHPRDTRGEPHGQREGREHRTSDGVRQDRPRDYPGAERRGAEPHPREPARASDREWPGRPEPPRWTDHGPPSSERDSRPPRERPQQSGRDSRPRDGKAATPPPAPSPAPQVDGIDPPINPDRARLLAEVDRPEIINPARAALISDTREPRGSRDQGRERPPRNESPRQSDHSGHGASQGETPRDDRHGRNRPSDYHAMNRDAQDSNAPHARGDRNADRDVDRDRRDSSSFGGPSARDEQHGRLSQQDPNYGRLNNPIPSAVADTPPAGPPSGPRGRGRNTARLSSLNNRPDGRFPGADPNRPPSPERGPPTGPSSSRQRRGQYDGGNNISPTTGAPPPPPPPPPPTGPGVHPDRLRHISQQPGVHPDRMGHISGPGPYSRPLMNTPDRPTTGPRPTPTSAINTPVSDVLSAHATPTGPSGGDRMRPGRQLRGIQSTLERASVDNTRSHRGPQSRGSRVNLANSDAQILTGSSPVTTPVQERQDPIRSESSRRDANTDRTPIQAVADSREARNGDDYGASARGDQDRGRREHHRSERASRASRRSSRERSPDREREAKEPREYRDRREGPTTGASNSHREGEREPGAPRRPHRESSSNNRDRESSSHRSHRSDLPRPDASGGRSEALAMGRGDRGDGHGGRRDGPSGRGEEYGGGRNGPSRGSGGPPRDSRPRPDERGDRRDERGRKRRSDADPNGDRAENKRARG